MFIKQPYNYTQNIQEKFLREIEELFHVTYDILVVKKYHSNPVSRPVLVLVCGTSVWQHFSCR